MLVHSRFWTGDGSLASFRTLVVSGVAFEPVNALGTSLVEAVACFQCTSSLISMMD